MSPDHELVSAYAKEGSESAFRSLVGRHVDLVYATALRQVGDPGIAEEVTQNVFVILARKAPRLAGLETLAGWLHRTALLEAKARIRAELRRQRREDIAARLAVAEQPHDEPDPAFAALVPLLDEALLHLRDGDRTALVLRFLEERSLREVGSALGVDEDAARKRVSRALDRVAHFFRQRGFPIGTGAAAVFAQATQAAPAAVAVTATQAGLAASGAATGLNLVLFHLMSLTKTQTALVCAVLVAAPLAYQQQVLAEARDIHSGLATQLGQSDAELASLQARLDREQDALRRAQLASVSAENRLAQLEQERASLAAAQPYRWDDQSPLVRVPKSYLKEMAPSGMTNSKGELSEAIRLALQITGEETAQINAATQSFLDRYHSAQGATLKPVAPDAADIGNRKPEDVRVFEIGGITDTVSSLRKDLFASWNQTLGEERGEGLIHSFRQWMPLTDGYHGLSSSLTIFNFDHRIRVYREFQRLETPTGEQLTLGWSLARAQGQSMSFPQSVEEMPPYLLPHLADWIEEAKRAEIIPSNPTR